MRKAIVPRIVMLTLALAMATAACASPPGAADRGTDQEGRPKAKLIALSPTMNMAVPQLLDSMQFDTKNGVDVDYQAVGSSSTNTISAVLGGDADFAVAASTTVLDAMKSSDQLVIVGGVVKAASTLAISKAAGAKTNVSADAPIQKRLRALKGMKIATNPEGSGNNQFLRLVLTKAGVDPNKDVTIVGVQDPSAVVAGIKQGQFDGAFYGAGVPEANIAAGEAVLWMSTSRGDVEPLVGDLIGAVVVTHRQTLQKNPELVSAMFDAFAATEKHIAGNPDAAGKALKSKWFPDLDQATFDETWKHARHAYPTDGRVTEEQFTVLTDMLASAGRKVDLDYRNAVYERAQG